MNFNTGEILFSQGVYSSMSSCNAFAKFVETSLERHKKGDWGDCCSEDKTRNDSAVVDGSRILSSYNHDKKIWIITEWNRSITTILFPSEY